MTVGTPTAGTVWNVGQTGLTTPLTALTGGCVSNTYVTSPGACGTSFPGGGTSTQITLQRTYRFPVQAAPYSVSEIGYSGNTSNDATCSGRLVLGSPDTIAITEYYVVQIAITFTVSPNVPTALGNVGTGINTTGQVMFNFWDCWTVNTTGGAVNYQTNYHRQIMDDGPPQLGLFTGVTPTLNANIAQVQGTLEAITYGSSVGAAYTNATLPVGVAQTTISFAFNTAGETVKAIYFGDFSSGIQTAAFALVLTTPFALPNGTFQGNFIYQRQITRTLSN
jgi:hypothetical protein